MIVKRYEMVAEQVAEYDTSIIGNRMKSSSDVAEFMMKVLNVEKYLQEKCFVFLLDTKLKTIAHFCITGVGTLDSAPVHPRDVFSPAIHFCAAACIFAHVHPSGDPTPSADDISVTNRLISAGNILGIKLLDSIVVGNGCWVSLKESGHVSFD